MFNQIHQIIMAVLVGLVIVLWRMVRGKIIKTHPRQFVLCVCLAVLCLLGTVVPVDRIFYRADSPEEVFDHISSKRILNTIYGDESCMIVSENYTGNACESTYIAHDEKGYMIPRIHTSRKVFSAPPGFPSFDVIQVSGTSDYYLSGMGAYSANELIVTDSLDSPFYIINTADGEEIGSEYTIYLYYAHLDSFDEDYCITIDGQSFCVGDMK